MLADRILEDAHVRRKGRRAAVSVRIPWYRALPLSSVTNVELSVDGEPANARSVTWSVNDHTYDLDELPERWDEWWYVLDTAVVEGAFGHQLGDSAHVEVQVGLYIPYLPVGDGFLAIAERASKTLPVEGSTA